MKLRTFFIYFALLVIATGCYRPSPVIIEEQYAPVRERLIQAPPRYTRASKIVIDAGHGGKDSGAQSLEEPKSQEKQLTLATAKMLNSYLRSLGFQTILTRTDDYFLPLELRSSLANSNQASIFVSVHYNAAANAKAEGIEVYYYKSDKDKNRSEQSKDMAEKVLNRVIASSKAKSRGVKHGDYAVIRETKMPAILIEGGFVTNEDELKKLRNPEYLKKIAQGIAQGINDYLESKGDRHR